MANPKTSLSLAELEKLRDIILDVDVEVDKKAYQMLPDDERELVFKLNRIIKQRKNYFRRVK